MIDTAEAPAVAQDILLPGDNMPLVHRGTQQLAPRQTRADQLMALAAQTNGNTEQMLQLLTVAERLKTMEVEDEKRANERAFNEAFAAFKAEAIQVIKSKTITDGPLKGKKQAVLADVIDAATGALARFGLSAAFRLTKDESDWIEVTCKLRHAGGHFEEVAMGGPPDKGPGRNAMQARGSTKTYLERYTLMAILGLSARELDDDGNGGGEGGNDGPSLGDTWKWKAQKATTLEALNDLWSRGVAVINKEGTRADYDAFKAAVFVRRAELVKATEGAAS